MFSFWKRRNKFTLDNLRKLCTILEKNPKLTNKNKQQVVETIREIAELMIYGDQNNDQFFFFLAEKNILRHFLAIIKQKYHRSITIQVMQTLSIMIQNISKKESLYYLFSNNYINDLIVHDFDFTDNEILSYYVSFLKTISLKLDRDVINFFFNNKANDFPLYSEALKFFKHSDQMIRIAVRTLTLHVFQVNDPDLRRFINDKSAVPYFSNIVWFIRDQCIMLNESVNKTLTSMNVVDVMDMMDNESISMVERSKSVSSVNMNLQMSMPQMSGSNSNTKKVRRNTAINLSSSFIESFFTTNNSSDVKQKRRINKVRMPYHMLEAGVEEQVDHYYYLEVECALVFYLCSILFNFVWE